MKGIGNFRFAAGDASYYYLYLFVCKIEMADKQQNAWELSTAIDAALLVIDSSLMYTDVWDLDSSRFFVISVKK